MNTPQQTAVLLDPHPLTLSEVERLLQELHISVVARTSFPSEALEAVRTQSPSLFILDIEAHDQDQDGSACLAAAKLAAPETRVLVLSAPGDPSRLDAAFAAGASAYILKTAHPDDVAAAIRQVFQRSIFFPPVQGHAWGLEWRRLKRDRFDSQYELTRRELETLALMAEGRSNREIARMLWITEETVKFHLANVYRKLNVANRTEASHWAHEHGLFAPLSQIPWAESR
jgi:DNA-binding NarL/FixJ family response regulator